MQQTGISGKLAVVTGAGGGIGAAIVRALLDEGARVAAMDRDAAALSGLETACRAGFDLTSTVVDVCDAVGVANAIDAIERERGPVDFGVNTAGILSITPIVSTSDETWRDVFAVNTHGVFHVSRALARHMVVRRRGAIVTVSSNAASVPRHGMAAYAASKAAATMFTKCLGLELAEFGIRCNVVAPGSTRTGMQEATWSAGSSESAVIAGSLATFRAGIPLGKIAEPREIAEAVLFLLSARASHITMAELCVDGGATLGA